MATPEEITAALEQLLQQEAALYREVRELSRGQLELIRQNNPAGLLQTVSQKQERLSRIEMIERTAAPLKKMREQNLDAWPAELRNRIAGPVRQLQTLLGEIVALEEQSRAAAESRAPGLGSEQRSGATQTGKAMLNAYAKVRRPQPPAADSGHQI